MIALVVVLDYGNGKRLKAVAAVVTRVEPVAAAAADGDAAGLLTEGWLAGIR